MRKLYDPAHDCGDHGAKSNDTRLGCRMCAALAAGLFSAFKGRSYWLAGAEARQIVLDHERVFRETTEKLLAALGVADDHGELLLENHVFRGYRLPYKVDGTGRDGADKPLPPGFVQGHGSYPFSAGWVVIGQRTAEGKRLAAIAKAHRLPSPEDLTKALCGEPWCYIQPGPGLLVRGCTYAVIHCDPNIVLQAPEGAKKPVGCELLTGST